KTGSELSVKSRYIEKNRPENQISIFWSIYFGELELIVPASLTHSFREFSHPHHLTKSLYLSDLGVTTII
ncbi:MAG: hypothetical protein LBM95_08320, partial [Lactobacillales bacterium]|nr:hypothetical protein [Lactobacillales bacterium]